MLLPLLEIITFWKQVSRGNLFYHSSSSYDRGGFINVILKILLYYQSMPWHGFESVLYLITVQREIMRDTLKK